MESLSTMSIQTQSQSKYKVELIFKGTVDDKQVEEEIVAILKNQFLCKITSEAHLPQALHSSPTNLNKGGQAND